MMVIEVHYKRKDHIVSANSSDSSNANANNDNVSKTILTTSEFMSMPIEDRLNYNGGIQVRCKECRHIYIDYSKRTPINLDISTCPYCNNINYFTYNHNRKRLWERVNTNSATVLSFLNRKDMPANAECEITIRFKDIPSLQEFLMHNEIKDMDVRLIF